METIYAALLLHKAGKPIEESSIEAVLTAAGLTPDKALIKATVTALKDIDIEKTIKEALVAPAAAAPAPKEEKKEEKKEKEEKKTEEEAAAGLSALFG
ncbi:MAG: 50S ribosomal protein P1 [Candidatus Nanoarchaeia archaeon]